MLLSSHLHIITGVAVTAALLLFAGCFTPQPREVITFNYDSVRNVTVLRSQPELIETYPTILDSDPELSIQAWYECPGKDTACLPLSLRARFILTNFREKRQSGLSGISRDVVRFREGDNITAKGDNWNMTLVIDSIGTAESRSSFYRGNETYSRQETTQYLYCAVTPERLQMLANSGALTLDIAGKQSFVKARKAPLKYLLEFCRRVRAKMGR